MKRRMMQLLSLMIAFMMLGTDLVSGSEVADVSSTKQEIQLMDEPTADPQDDPDDTDDTDGENTGGTQTGDSGNTDRTQTGDSGNTGGTQTGDSGNTGGTQTGDSGNTGGTGNTDSNAQKPGTTTPVYTSKVTSLSADYKEDTKCIHIEWTTENAVSVNVTINDTELLIGYKGNSYDIAYKPQAGVQYTVTVTPFDEKGVEGEEDTDIIVEGDFSTPDIASLTPTYTQVLDAKGKNTGFAKPSVIITWEGQENARYAIYHASKDKEYAYTWLATVSTPVEGVYTVVDQDAVVGTNYYRICQLSVQDELVEQAISTSLSDPELIEMKIPKASLDAVQQDDGTVKLTMGLDCAYASGYTIYRKTGSGGYKKIAETTSNTFVDETVLFGKVYAYKVRAFYHNTKTSERKYGAYSKGIKIKNTVGRFDAKAALLSSQKVKISWNKAANALKYEVYYKTDIQGDSYTLLDSTKKLSIIGRLKKATAYDVMIKAYCQTNKGMDYFSYATVSFNTGFSAPANFAVKSTSYTLDPATYTFVQKDKLVWDRVYGASGYYIECYNTITKNFEVIAKVKGSSKNSFTVSNYVTPLLKMQQYRVSAYKGSKVLTGQTIDVTIGLDTVKDIKAKTSGSSTKISWKGVTGAQMYRVFRSNGRNVVLIGVTSSQSFKDQGTDKGVTYTYYVQAVNSSNNVESVYGEGAEYTRSIQKVTTFKARNMKKRKVRLSWKRVSGAEGYVIYYKGQDDQVYTKLKELTAKSNTYTHTGLQPDEKYTYRIAVVYHNIAGVAAESAVKSVSVKVKQ